MTAIIKSDLRFYVAEQVYEAIEAGSPDTFYVFIGKPDPWGPNIPDDDLFPATPGDDQNSCLRLHENMLSMKRINPGQLSYVIRRFDWDQSQNTVYVPYRDDDSNLYNHPTEQEILDASIGGYTPGSFYVMNQFFQVFKCLENANGAVSAVEPVAVESNPLPEIRTADGYLWKYMFTLQSFDVVKFLTTHWMPIKTLESDDGSPQWVVQEAALAASDGQISNVVVEDGGFGFSKVQPNLLLLNGATTTTALLDGSASSVNNYYTGATIWIENGLGGGQSRVILGYDGVTKQVTVEPWDTVPGASDQYRILPTVTFEGNGTGARAKAFVDAIAPNDITFIQMIDFGSGYDYASATVTGAGGQQAIVHASVGPVGNHGSDPVKELGGFNIMLSTDLSFNEGNGDFIVSNDFRQIGLIKNPLNFGTQVVATAPTLRAAKQIIVSNPTGNFETDELITGATANPNINPTGYVVQIDDDTAVAGRKIITYIQTPETGFDDFSLSVGYGIVGSESAETATVDVVTPPEHVIYKGDILYYENRRPVLRAPNQLESIRIVIAF